VLRQNTSSRTFASSILVTVLVGCGGIAVFDDGTGGQGGATTAFTSTSKTSTGTSKTSGTQSQTNSGIVATSSTIVTTPTPTTSVTTTATATTAIASTAVTTTGTGQMLPCEAACEDDPGCNSDPPFPGGECGQCVFNEVMNIPSSTCAVSAAFGPSCQGNPQCSELIMCVLNSGDLQGCAIMNPSGIQTLLTQVFAACGRCGTCPSCQECCLED
jgi:hypothetical protein